MQPSTDGSRRPPSPDKAAPRVLRPRDAATLIVIDRRGRSPKILMGRRNPGLAFMPGKFVFPGGRIEPGDRRMPVAGALPERSESALQAMIAKPPLHLGRALALAALRETYEETGLLVGTTDYGPPEQAPEGSWRAFQAHGVMPDLEALHLVARAITPPGRPRRFDTRFFAVDRTGVAAEAPGVVCDTAELVELAWVKLADARKLELPYITGVILDELEAQIAGGFAPHRPIPFHFQRHGKRERVLI